VDDLPVPGLDVEDLEDAADEVAIRDEGILSPGFVMRTSRKTRRSSRRDCASTGTSPTRPRRRDDVATSTTVNGSPYLAAEKIVGAPLRSSWRTSGPLIADLLLLGDRALRPAELERGEPSPWITPST
jgi:hypothetical protein